MHNFRGAVSAAGDLTAKIDNVADRLHCVCTNSERWESQTVASALNLGLHSSLPGWYSGRTLVCRVGGHGFKPHSKQIIKFFGLLRLLAGVGL